MEGASDFAPILPATDRKEIRAHEEIKRGDLMTIQFFLPMIPPTVTAQEKRLGVSRAGKAYVYDSPDVKDARAKFTAALVQARERHGPQQKITTGIRLTTRWCYRIPEGSQHFDGEYKITKPDTDNAVKLFKDCMTCAGFWKDDALVASELIEKFWADRPGIYVKIETFERGNDA